MQLRERPLLYMLGMIALLVICAMYSRSRICEPYVNYPPVFYNMRVLFPVYGGGYPGGGISTFNPGFGGNWGFGGNGGLGGNFMPGNDSLGGTPGSDYLGGTPGSDYLGGTPGSDYLGGTPGSDYLGGTPGSSSLGGTPTGDKPTGDKPTGDKPTGDKPTGDKPTGDKPTGDKPTGDKPTGNKPTGDKPTGDKPTGDKPTGDKPTGNKPTGDKPDGSKGSPNTSKVIEFQHNNRCLANENGKPKFILDCKALDGNQRVKQNAMADGKFTLDIAGNCLTSDGTQVTFKSCAGSDTQYWSNDMSKYAELFEEKGSMNVVHVKSKKCLDANANGDVYMSKCDPKNGFQKFGYAEVAAGGTGGNDNGGGGDNKMTWIIVGSSIAAVLGVTAIIGAAVYINTRTGDVDGMDENGERNGKKGNVDVNSKPNGEIDLKQKNGNGSATVTPIDNNSNGSANLAEVKTSNGDKKPGVLVGTENPTTKAIAADANKGVIGAMDINSPITPDKMTFWERVKKMFKDIFQSGQSYQEAKNKVAQAAADQAAAKAAAKPKQFPNRFQPRGDQVAQVIYVDAEKAQQDADAAKAQQDADAAKAQQDADAAKAQQDADAAKAQQDADAAAAKAQQDADAAKAQQDADASGSRLNQGQQDIADLVSEGTENMYEQTVGEKKIQWTYDPNLGGYSATVNGRFLARYDPDTDSLVDMDKNVVKKFPDGEFIPDDVRIRGKALAKPR